MARQRMLMVGNEISEMTDMCASAEGNIFRRINTDLDSLITTDVFSKLCHHFNISSAEQHRYMRHKPGKQALEYLETTLNITFDNVDFLKKAFKSLNMKEAAAIVDIHMYKHSIGCAFSKLKTTLSDDFVMEDCNKLCTCFSIPPANQERILAGRPSGLDLLKYLEAKKIIQCYDVDRLKTALKELNMGEAGSKVECYKKSVGDLFCKLKKELAGYFNADVCNRLCTFFDIPVVEEEPLGLKLLEDLEARKIIQYNNVERLREALVEVANAVAENSNYSDGDIEARGTIQSNNVAVLEESNMEATVTVVEKSNISDGDLEARGTIQSNNVAVLEEPTMEATVTVVEDSNISDDVITVGNGSISDSDDLFSDDEIEYDTQEETFEDFKQRMQLNQMLTLDDMLRIKDPERTPVLPSEAFWDKITSLDYRVTSLDLQGYNSISIRDLIFTILHCSCNFLRRDIMTKLSSCQLAVPLILQGAEGRQPTFLKWALGGIYKKVKIPDFCGTLEEPIISLPIFTVTFLRVGEVRLSKSDFLNYLMSECQGNQKHSFFLNRLNDVVKPNFSCGSVEVAWYIPHGEINRSLRHPVAFVNLRGDSSKYLTQMKFACKAANLTVVLIQGEIYKDPEYKDHIDLINDKSGNTLFVVFNEEDNPHSTHKSKFKKSNTFLVVHNLQVKDIAEKVCSRIVSICNSGQPLTEMKFKMELYVDRDIRFDVSKENEESIAKTVESIVPDKIAKKTFKVNILRLYPHWQQWVEIDNKKASLERHKNESVEETLMKIEGEKYNERKKQIEVKLSSEVESFCQLMNTLEGDKDTFNYCIKRLQEKLFGLTQNLFKHVDNNKYILENKENDTERCDEKIISPEGRESEGIDKLERYNKKIETQWRLTIGMEDFIRELGQLHEAHWYVRNKDPISTDCAHLPLIVARYLIQGYPLELLDDKTYTLQEIWIADVFEELSKCLENARIIVVGVIGAQSSGKSTLLNSLFGTYFPVQAGRCTKGLFCRLIQIEKDLSSKVGFEYLLILDTEGLRSDHGGEADNLSNKKLDNKMVTLAMCVADLTIINVLGECIGPEITGFLQIAAHALIRMTEVRLKSRCIFVQQRVSDITAQESNRTMMLKIISHLDNAVSTAAEAESLSDQYGTFSDIFELDIEDDTKFIPNLWNGNMNPPNPSYSESIKSLKDTILKLTPQFTISSFKDRLVDVCKALTEENFILNFEDTTKAIEYNEFSYQCNKWIADARFDIHEWWQTSQREIRNAESASFDDACLKTESILNDKIDEHEKNIDKSFKLYTSGKERLNSSHSDFLRLAIKSSIESLRIDIKEKVRNEKIALQWVTSDIPQFIQKQTTVLRHKAKKLVLSLQRNEDTSNLPESVLKERFERGWKEWINQVQNEFESNSVSKENICEEYRQMLLHLGLNSAVHNDIVRLFKKEGDLRKHSRDFKYQDYIPSKPNLNLIKKKANVRKNTERIQTNVEAFGKQVVFETLEKLREKCYKKAFDANLIQLSLQQCLEELTLTDKSSEDKPPTILIAKILLHICAQSAEIVWENQMKYNEDTSLLKQFEQQKIELCDDFLALYSSRETELVEKAFQILRKKLIIAMKHTLMNKLTKTLNITFVADIQSKDSLHYIILEDLFLATDPLKYIEYITNTSNFIASWLHIEMAKWLVRQDGGKSWIQAENERHIKHYLSYLKNKITPSSEQKCSQSESMEKWCESFKDLVTCTEYPITLDFKDLLIYDVSNFKELTTKVVTFLENDLLKEICEVMSLPGIDEISHCIKLLETETNSPYEIILKDFLGCQARCPFCGAPCKRPKHTIEDKHQAYCHYPRGLSGKKWDSSRKLVEEFCTSSVLSKDRSYEINDEFHLYKDYANDYPNWKLSRHKDLDSEMAYWRWVMTHLNDYCAQYYQCLPADIPSEWNLIVLMDLPLMKFSNKKPLRRAVGNLIRTTKVWKNIKRTYRSGEKAAINSKRQQNS